MPVLTQLLPFSNSYLKSPIVDLVVGSGQDQTVLRAILMDSPFFAEAVAQFSDFGPVRLILSG